MEEVIFGNISLDAEVGDDGKDSLGDLIEDSTTLRPDQHVEREIIRENLDTILAMLDEREAKIIKMRYGIDGPKYTLEQVGAEFNVTRERVRQIEQKVLTKLKEHIGLQKMIGIEDDIEKMEQAVKQGKRVMRTPFVEDEEEEKDEWKPEIDEDDEDYSLTP